MQERLDEDHQRRGFPLLEDIVCVWVFVSTGAVGRGLLVLVFPRTHACRILAVFRVKPHSATLHAHAARRRVTHKHTGKRQNAVSINTTLFYQELWINLSLWFTCDFTNWCWIALWSITCNNKACVLFQKWVLKESSLYCVWIHHIKLCLYPVFILPNISIHSWNFWISQWCEFDFFLLKASLFKWKNTKLFSSLSAFEAEGYKCHWMCEAASAVPHCVWVLPVPCFVEVRFFFQSEEAGRGFLCQYTPCERISGGDVTSSEVWTAPFVPVWASLGRNYFR